MHFLGQHTEIIIKYVLGAPMATQHQTPGYRGQWNNVGSGHQHPAAVGATYQSYQRYPATAQTQQPPNAQLPQNQQQHVSYSSAASNYNNANSVSTMLGIWTLDLGFFLETVRQLCDWLGRGTDADPYFFRIYVYCKYAL